MIDFSPIIAAVIAFAVCGILGFFIIPYLHRLKFGQTILDIGPQWHKAKQGTPTMGGVMMVIALVIGIAAALGYSFLSEGRLAIQLKEQGVAARLIAGIAFALGMGAIGFIDDYIKVVKKRNLGLTAKQKTFLQFLVGALYLAALYFSGMDKTWLPFLGDISVISGFGILFWPIALVFIYGFSNAVNLTDGVDGLASTVTMIVCAAFMLMASALGLFSQNILAAAAVGACAGFLLWNANPAKVFMGDTGSLFLGGVVISLSFGIDRPILLIFAGIIYVAEAFSVMLQVAYFSKTGKRIFKMAPIHHHYEMCGWSEGKIVFVFSIVTFIGCVIAGLPFIINF